MKILLHVIPALFYRRNIQRSRAFISATSDPTSAKPETGRIAITMLLPKDADIIKWEKELTEAVTSYYMQSKYLTASAPPMCINLTQVLTNYSTLVKAQNELFTKVANAVS